MSVSSPLGAAEAEKLLKEVEKLYPNSPLFLYFQGKIFYLKVHLYQGYMNFIILNPS